MKILVSFHLIIKFPCFFNRIRNRCNEVCTGSSGNVPEMNFASVRLTKSESSDRGNFLSNFT